MTDKKNAMGASPQPTHVVNAFDAGFNRPMPAPPVWSQSSPAWEQVRARVAAMDPDHKALAAKQAEILAVAGQGLAARPYAERRAILSHMAPHLAAFGVGNEQAGGFDPTDTNLARAVGEAVILRSMLGSIGAASPTPSTQSPAAPTE